MKNYFLLILLMVSLLFGYGQQLPNNDFEEWEATGNYQNPKHWNTPNVFTSLAGETVVEKSEDAYSNSYSVRLESNVISFLSQTFLAPGAITLADFNINPLNQTFTYSGGYFLQQNVYQLKGMYKYRGANNDSATILMYNFRNRQGETYDTIGYGYTYLNDADEWTPFTVTMRYINGHVPDTFNVLIMSTTDEGLQDMSHGGSELFIDSLTIYTNTGIINLWEKPSALYIYPNPSNSIINFEAERTGKKEISIYDRSGRLIKSYDFNDLLLTIDISGFKAGLYSYMVTANKKIINSGSFIKE